MKMTKPKLRAWDASDIDTLVKYANNWNVAKNLTDQFPFPYSEKDGRAFIHHANATKPLSIFAIDMNGEAVGAIVLEQQKDIHRKNAEMGYWLAEPYWGKGIMTDAIKQMVDYGFTTFDIDRIFARPFGTNKASRRVLEKNNFVLEAKFEKTLFKRDEYLDELVYAIRRNSWLRQ
jgi:[ribosomal protein S5]-alanine N-acetyltransferase